MRDAIAGSILGYLLGSLPFGYWAGRLKGVDLRKVGSGNTGGTNAIRILGARYGVPVILLDMAKGVAAVLIAGQFGGATVEVVAAAGAVLGTPSPSSCASTAARLLRWARARCSRSPRCIGVLVTLVWFVVAAMTRYVFVGFTSNGGCVSQRSPSSSTSHGRCASSRWPEGCS